VGAFGCWYVIFLFSLLVFDGMAANGLIVSQNKPTERVTRTSTCSILERLRLWC
jgi:hypothetical protein